MNPLRVVAFGYGLMRRLLKFSN